MGNPRDPVMREEGERALSPEQKARFWETALSIVFPKSPIKWDEVIFLMTKTSHLCLGAKT